MESAQRNAITSLATLFVTPSLRARFLNHAPASPWLSGGFGYGLYEGSSVLQNGTANAEIHRSVATAQFGGGIDIRRRLKLTVPDRLQRRGSGLLHVKHAQLRRSSSAHAATQCRRLGRIGCPLLDGSARRSASEHGRSDVRSPRRPRAPVSGRKPRGSRQS